MIQIFHWEEIKTQEFINPLMGKTPWLKIKGEIVREVVAPGLIPL